MGGSADPKGDLAGGLFVFRRTCALYVIHVLVSIGFLSNTRLLDNTNTKLLSFGAKQRSDEESVSDRNGMEGWLRQTAPSAVKQARSPGCLLLLLLPGFINLLQH